MAETKVSQLTALDTPAANDLLYVVDTSAGTSGGKKITLGDFFDSAVFQTAADGVPPSGDATGVTDRTNIQAALDTDNFCQLLDGTYYVDTTIVLDSDSQTLIGSGNSTSLWATDTTYPVIRVKGAGGTNNNYWYIGHLRILLGNYSIELEDCSRGLIEHVFSNVAGSHGIYLNDDVWIVTIRDCTIRSNGGDGINSITSGSSPDTGNALAVDGCCIESNTGHGIRWSAACLWVTNCTIEGNDDSGVLLDAQNGNASGIFICGNYFEQNATACIEFSGSDSYVIMNGCVDGNRLDCLNSTPGILMGGTSGASDHVREIYFGASNDFSTNATYHYECGTSANRCVFADLTDGDHDMTSVYKSYQRSSSRAARQMVTETWAVACNEDKTDADAALITFPAGTLVHQVVVECTEAMDGITTTTFEVGASNNTDKYIDPNDFDPSTLDAIERMVGGTGSNNQTSVDLLQASTTNIVARWTNTGGTPSTGEVVVRITYSEPVSPYANAVAVPT